MQKNNMHKLFDTLIIAIGLLVLFVVFVVPIRGFHYETGRGQHTGYITAVEKTGVFFKTGTMYFKTDAQSSQEDKYCFTNQYTELALDQYSRSRTQVVVSYYSWLSAGIANCAGEGQIVYRVEPVIK